MDEPKQEREQEEKKLAAKEEIKADEPPRYTYRWTYEAQAAHDREMQKRERKKGAGVYALVMAIAFAVCLAILGGTVLISALAPADTSLSATEISELVNPGTVLIYASNADGGGYGTGFFIRSDGYILTNYHIVSGKSNVEVQTYDGLSKKATVKWYSTYDDLALIKIEGQDYPTLVLGNSDSLQVGATAIAIGNPGGNLCPWTLTQGVISAVNRTVTVNSGRMIVDLTMIQTDAQVNPGNSGGPLCNDRGEVIGIVARKMTDYEGLGLAIPINGAMELVNAYLTNGTVDERSSAVSKARPAIGVQVVDVAEGEEISDGYKAREKGVLVTMVEPDGVSQGLLRAGDVILSMDGHRVETSLQLKELLYNYRPGDQAKLQIDRYGKELTVTVRFTA